jgi:signal transduction histidine kinase
VETDTDKLKELNAIENYVGSMFSLVDSIVLFSNIEAGEIELSTGSVNLAILIETCAHILNQNDKNDNPFGYLVDESIPATINTDSEKLQQLIVNLGECAMKFKTDENVDLHVHLLKETEKSYTIAFRIRNFGIMCPEDEILDIFKPFFEVKHVITKKILNNGLNLAIAKNLVNLFGGQLNIETKGDSLPALCFTIKAFK